MFDIKVDVFVVNSGVFNLEKKQTALRRVSGDLALTQREREFKPNRSFDQTKTLNRRRIRGAENKNVTVSLNQR